MTEEQLFRTPGNVMPGDMVSAEDQSASDLTSLSEANEVRRSEIDHPRCVYTRHGLRAAGSCTRFMPKFQPWESTRYGGLATAPRGVTLKNLDDGGGKNAPVE